MTDQNPLLLAERSRKRKRTQSPSKQGTASGQNDPIRRVTRACDQCRAHKKRCDSGHPCQTCRKASLDCQYGKQHKKRGFPTGYVRIVEALWALVFRAVPNGEETALKLLEDSSIGYDDQGKVTLLNNHFDKIDSSRNAWLSSRIRHEIDKLSLDIEEGEDINLPHEHDNSSTRQSARRPSFSTSNIDAWSIAQNTIDPDLDNATGHDTVIGGLSISIPPDAWRLTEVYFQFYNSWLPVIPKYNAIRALTEIQDGTIHEAGQRSVLHAIFALAQSSCSATKRSPQAENHYHEAIRAIPGDLQMIELSHVQALALLTVSDMADAQWERASLVSRRTVRAVLYLQRSTPHRQMGASSAAIFKRVILAVFSLETLLAVQSDTLPQLRPRDISWALDYDENDADEWEQYNSSTGQMTARTPLRTLSTFKEYIKLLMILNDCLCDLRAGKHNELQARIFAWKIQLPKHCHFPATTTTDHHFEVLPAIANLHLTAEAVSQFLITKQARTSGKPIQMLHDNESQQISIFETTYRKTFGSAAWRGILDIYERVTRSGIESGQLQDFAPGNVALSNSLSYPEAQDMRNDTCEGFLPNDVDSTLAGPSTLDPSDMQAGYFASIQTNVPQISGEHTSIETLLGELSSQQNMSWNELDAQCMYNLGFTQADNMTLW